MALTVTETDDNILGARKSKIVNVTFDSSYATGGEDFTPASLGFQEFYLVLPAPTAGYVFDYVASTKKLRAFRIPALDGNAASAAPLAEVSNAVNLSTVTCKVLVIGF